MSQHTGRLEFRDLGAGTWLLHTDHGEKLQLAGSIPAELDGKRVIVTGRRASLHGYGMAGGGGLDVERVEPVK
ncbi:MAG: hypothetical protein EP330_18240 [Deltaproteobacteria bacterium]|nr:MAG: hypothetical protein EP330_18240 [Deltaproteobacteria bacterium]